MTLDCHGNSDITYFEARPEKLILIKTDIKTSLNMYAQLSNRVLNLAYGVNRHRFPYFMPFTSECSGQSMGMHDRTKMFSGLLCYKSNLHLHTIPAVSKYFLTRKGHAN